LHAYIADVALDVLAALWAGEFEFSHKFYQPQGVPTSELVTLTSNFFF
jgi:hypothetical protein